MSCSLMLGAVGGTHSLEQIADELDGLPARDLSEPSSPWGNEVGLERSCGFNGCRFMQASELTESCRFSRGRGEGCRMSDC